VDDDPQPIAKLQMLVQAHYLFFSQTRPEDLIPLANVAAELQAMLQRTGYYDGPLSGQFDAVTRNALRQLVGVENLEERWDGTGELIDRQVVAYLLDRFG
jgi:uncharacterized Ntn-hydrolase superfamily protein